MKNINLEPNNYYFLKILLYLMISIFIFLYNSKIIYSNEFNKNINNREIKIISSNSLNLEIPSNSHKSSFSNGLDDHIRFFKKKTESLHQ